MVTSIIDRLTGLLIHTPATPLAEGRYLLKDRLLVSDGSSSISDNNGQKWIFDPEQMLLDFKDAEHGLLIRTFEELSKQRAFGGAVKDLSPLIPGTVLDEVELTSFENLLKDVIEKKHLHDIAKDPYSDLCYEEKILPVERVRRLANTAVSHLASHSEDWAAKTLLGVRPRRVKALLSRVQLDLYENRLYVRLLERIQHYLSERLKKVDALQRNLQDANKLEKSDHLHHPLRDRLTDLWGKAFSHQSIQTKINVSNNSRHEIETLLVSIRQLRRTELAILLRQRAHVPSQPQVTNVLQHHPHYRHVLHLWIALNQVDKALKPSNERQIERCEYQTDFYRYVGLVLDRVIDTLPVSSVECISNNQLQHYQLKTGQGTIRTSLTIAPIATTSSRLLDESHSTIQCCITATDAENLPMKWILTPRDFYIEERVKYLLNHWRIQHIVNYLKPIQTSKWSRPLLDLLQNKGFFLILHAKLSLNPILEINQLNTIRMEIGRIPNPPESLQHMISALHELTVCPVCGKPGRSLARTGFSHACQQGCSVKWSLGINDHSVSYNATPTDGYDQFETAGAGLVRVSCKF